MKVYYTSTDIEVVSELERLVHATLENTGRFGRFWTELSKLDTRAAKLPQDMRFIFSAVRIFTVINVRLCQCVKPAAKSGTASCWHASYGIEAALETRVNQVGRTVAHTVTQGVSSTAANVGNTFRKFGAMIKGDDPDMVKVTSASPVSSLAGELIEMQQKTLTIVCVYNADTSGKPAPAGGGGTYKSGVISQPLGVWAASRACSATCSSRRPGKRNGPSYHAGPGARGSANAFSAMTQPGPPPRPEAPGGSFASERPARYSGPPPGAECPASASRGTRAPGAGRRLGGKHYPLCPTGLVRRVVADPRSSSECGDPDPRI